MRPKSIDQFSLVYAIIILAGLVSTWLSWEGMLSQVSVQQMMAQLGASSVYIIALVGVIIQLALWYFITQRGSAVAKWIFVVLTVLAILSGLWGLSTGGSFTSLIGIIGVVLLILQAVAVWLLFRPDTRAWFGETAPE